MKSDCILSVSAVHCSLNNLINIKIDWWLTTNSSSLVLRVSLGQQYSNYVWGPFGGLWVVTVFIVILRRYLGLPWWRSGWESACQCRGHGFKPWSGKIPHAAEQLGLWATITEPARLEPVLRNERGHDSERPAHHDEEWPLLAATRESPRTETKTQHKP